MKKIRLFTVPNGRFSFSAISRYLKPVSYTHLDVYKRQPLDGSGNSVKAQLAIEYIMNKLRLNVFGNNRITIVD